MNKDDVRRVARELLEFSVHHEDYGDSYPYGEYVCYCCEGTGTQSIDDFTHELGCPILIAQDLLTEGREE